MHIFRSYGGRLTAGMGSFTAIPKGMKSNLGLDGAPTRIIRKENTAVAVSEKEKAAYKKEYAQAPYLRIHFPDFHSAFQKFTVDEKGWLYVMTWERTDKAAGYRRRLRLTRSLYRPHRPESDAPVVGRKSALYAGCGRVRNRRINEASSGMGVALIVFPIVPGAAGSYDALHDLSHPDPRPR